MPRPGRMTTERAKDFKGTLLQLVRNLGRYRLSLVTAIVFAILSTIFNIAGPKVLAKATTALATGWIAKLRGTGSIDFVYIGRILLFLLGMYLLSSAFSFIQGWLMTGLSQKVCYDFRKQISEKINRLPLAYFEKRTVGEVLSRITNDVDTLGQSLNQSITQLITSVTTMIGVLVMMLSIRPLRVFLSTTRVYTVSAPDFREEMDFTVARPLTFRSGSCTRSSSSAKSSPTESLILAVPSSAAVAVYSQPSLIQLLLSTAVPSAVVLEVTAMRISLPLMMDWVLLDVVILLEVVFPSALMVISVTETVSRSMEWDSMPLVEVTRAR